MVEYIQSFLGHIPRMLHQHPTLHLSAERMRPAAICIHFLTTFSYIIMQVVLMSSAVNNTKAVSAMLVALTKISNSKYSGVYDNLGRFVILMSCLDA